MTLVSWPRRLTLDPIDPHEMCRVQREAAVNAAAALDAENRDLIIQNERLSVWVAAKGGNPRNVRLGKP